MDNPDGQQRDDLQDIADNHVHFSVSRHGQARHSLDSSHQLRKTTDPINHHNSVNKALEIVDKSAHDLKLLPISQTYGCDLQGVLRPKSTGSEMFREEHAKLDTQSDSNLATGICAVDLHNGTECFRNAEIKLDPKTFHSIVCEKMSKLVDTDRYYSDGNGEGNNPNDMVLNLYKQTSLSWPNILLAEGRLLEPLRNMCYRSQNDEKTTRLDHAKKETEKAVQVYMCGPVSHWNCYELSASVFSLNNENGVNNQSQSTGCVLDNRSKIGPTCYIKQNDTNTVAAPLTPIQPITRTIGKLDESLSSVTLSHDNRLFDMPLRCVQCVQQNPAPTNKSATCALIERLRKDGLNDSDTSASQRMMTTANSDRNGKSANARLDVSPEERKCKNWTCHSLHGRKENVTNRPQRITFRPCSAARDSNQKVRTFTLPGINTDQVPRNDKASVRKTGGHNPSDISRALMRNNTLHTVGQSLVSLNACSNELKSLIRSTILDMQKYKPIVSSGTHIQIFPIREQAPFSLSEYGHAVLDKRPGNKLAKEEGHVSLKGGIPVYERINHGTYENKGIRSYKPSHNPICVHTSIDGIKLKEENILPHVKTDRLKTNNSPTTLKLRRQRRQNILKRKRIIGKDNIPHQIMPNSDCPTREAIESIAISRNILDKERSTCACVLNVKDMHYQNVALEDQLRNSESNDVWSSPNMSKLAFRKCLPGMETRTDDTRHWNMMYSSTMPTSRNIERADGHFNSEDLYTEAPRHLNRSTVKEAHETSHGNEHVIPNYLQGKYGKTLAVNNRSVNGIANIIKSSVRITNLENKETMVQQEIGVKQRSKVGRCDEYIPRVDRIDTGKQSSTLNAYVQEVSNSCVSNDRLFQPDHNHQNKHDGFAFMNENNFGELAQSDKMSGAGSIAVLCVTDVSVSSSNLENPAQNACDKNTNDNINSKTIARRGNAMKMQKESYVPDRASSPHTKTTPKKTCILQSEKVHRSNENKAKTVFSGNRLPLENWRCFSENKYCSLAGQLYSSTRNYNVQGAPYLNVPPCCLTSPNHSSVTSSSKYGLLRYSMQDRQPTPTNETQTGRMNVPDLRQNSQYKVDKKRLLDEIKKRPWDERKLKLLKQFLCISKQSELIEGGSLYRSKTGKLHGKLTHNQQQSHPRKPFYLPHKRISSQKCLTENRQPPTSSRPACVDLARCLCQRDSSKDKWARCTRFGVDMVPTARHGGDYSFQTPSATKTVSDSQFIVLTRDRSYSQSSIEHSVTTQTSSVASLYLAKVVRSRSALYSTDDSHRLLQIVQHVSPDLLRPSSTSQSKVSFHLKHKDDIFQPLAMSKIVENSDIVNNQKKAEKKWKAHQNEEIVHVTMNPSFESDTWHYVPSQYNSPDKKWCNNTRLIKDKGIPIKSSETIVNNSDVITHNDSYIYVPPPTLSTQTYTSKSLASRNTFRRHDNQFCTTETKKGHHIQRSFSDTHLTDIADIQHLTSAASMTQEHLRHLVKGHVLHDQSPPSIQLDREQVSYMEIIHKKGQFKGLRLSALDDLRFPSMLKVSSSDKVKGPRTDGRVQMFNHQSSISSSASQCVCNLRSANSWTSDFCESNTSTSSGQVSSRGEHLSNRIFLTTGPFVKNINPGSVPEQDDLSTFTFSEPAGYLDNMIYDTHACNQECAFCWNGCASKTNFLVDCFNDKSEAKELKTNDKKRQTTKKEKIPAQNEQSSKDIVYRRFHAPLSYEYGGDANMLSRSRKHGLGRESNFNPVLKYEDEKKDFGSRMHVCDNASCTDSERDNVSCTDRECDNVSCTDRESFMVLKTSVIPRSGIEKVGQDSRSRTQMVQQQEKFMLHHLTQMSGETSGTEQNLKELQHTARNKYVFDHERKDGTVRSVCEEKEDQPDCFSSLELSSYSLSLSDRIHKSPKPCRGENRPPHGIDDQVSSLNNPETDSQSEANTISCKTQHSQSESSILSGKTQHARTISYKTQSGTKFRPVTLIRDKLQRTPNSSKPSTTEIKYSLDAKAQAQHYTSTDCTDESNKVYVMNGALTSRNVAHGISKQNFISDQTKGITDATTETPKAKRLKCPQEVKTSEQNQAVCYEKHKNDKKTSENIYAKGKTPRVRVMYKAKNTAFTPNLVHGPLKGSVTRIAPSTLLDNSSKGLHKSTANLFDPSSPLRMTYEPDVCALTAAIKVSPSRDQQHKGKTSHIRVSPSRDLQHKGKTSLTRVSPSRDLQYKGKTSYIKVSPSRDQQDKGKTSYIRVSPSRDQQDTGKTSYIRVSPSRDQQDTGKTSYTRASPSRDQQDTGKTSHIRVSPSRNKQHKGKISYIRVSPSRDQQDKKKKLITRGSSSRDHQPKGKKLVTRTSPSRQQQYKGKQSIFRTSPYRNIKCDWNKMTTKVLPSITKQCEEKACHQNKTDQMKIYHPSLLDSSDTNRLNRDTHASPCNRTGTLQSRQVGPSQNLAEDTSSSEESTLDHFSPTSVCKKAAPYLGNSSVLAQAQLVNSINCQVLSALSFLGQRDQFKLPHPGSLISSGQTSAGEICGSYRVRSPVTDKPLVMNSLFCNSPFLWCDPLVDDYFEDKRKSNKKKNSTLRRAVRFQSKTLQKQGNSASLKFETFGDSKTIPDPWRKNIRKRKKTMCHVSNNSPTGQAIQGKCAAKTKPLQQKPLQTWINAQKQSPQGDFRKRVQFGTSRNTGAKMSLDVKKLTKTLLPSSPKQNIKLPNLMSIINNRSQCLSSLKEQTHVSANNTGVNCFRQCCTSPRQLLTWADKHCKEMNLYKQITASQKVTRCRPKKSENKTLPVDFKCENNSRFTNTQKRNCLTSPRKENKGAHLTGRSRDQTLSTDQRGSNGSRNVQLRMAKLAHRYNDNTTLSTQKIKSALTKNVQKKKNLVFSKDGRCRTPKYPFLTSDSNTGSSIFHNTTDDVSASAVFDHSSTGLDFPRRTSQISKENSHSSPQPYVLHKETIVQHKAQYHSHKNDILLQLRGQHNNIYFPKRKANLLRITPNLEMIYNEQPQQQRQYIGQRPAGYRQLLSHKRGTKHHEKRIYV